MSATKFVSPSTRLSAFDANAIQRPSAEIVGNPDQSLPVVMSVVCCVRGAEFALTGWCRTKALRIKVAQSIRSVVLAESLLSVARKLEGLLESSICRFIRREGFALACRASLAAVKMGNIFASSWSSDCDYARFLAVMKYNSGSAGLNG